MTNIRESVRGIIIHKDDNKYSALLMHRIKNGNEYWVLPGGWIEAGEDCMQAFQREMEEEIGSDITLANIQHVMTTQSVQNDVVNVQHVYQCDYVSGTIGSGTGPEFTERLSHDNFYQIEVVSREDIKNINLVPAEIQTLVGDIIRLRRENNK